MSCSKGIDRLILLSLFFTTVGCSDSRVQTGPQMIASVSVSPSSTSFTSIGDSVQLSATLIDEEGVVVTDRMATWHSSDSTIVRVRSGGWVTSASNGTATITASIDGRSDQAVVTVEQRVDSVAVEVLGDTLTAIGDTVRATAAGVDANGHEVPGQAASWESSDPAIAMVDDYGLITAVAAGTATITASIDGGSDQAVVTVEQRVDSVAVEVPADTLTAIGDTVRLTAQGLDANGHEVPGQTASWMSSDSEVATVDEGGLVTAVGPGTVTVSVEFDELAASLSRRSTTAEQSGDPLVTSASVTLVVEQEVASLSAVASVPAKQIIGSRVPLSVRISDARDHGIAGHSIIWTVVSGTGEVSITSVTGVDGVGHATWTLGRIAGSLEAVEARSGAREELAVNFETQTALAQPPYSFVSDVVVLSPGEPAELDIVDANGAKLPTADVQLTITTWQLPAVDMTTGLFNLDDSGKLTMVGGVAGEGEPFRLTASYMEEAVPGKVMVLAHNIDRKWIVVATEHWRLLVPASWIEQFEAHVPDFDEALDAGWEAQQEIMGKAANELGAELEPELWFGWDGITARESVCGVSGTPILLSTGCALDPTTGDPRWGLILHELGHNNTLGHRHTAYCVMLCGVGTYVESDATLLGMWSTRWIGDDLSLSQAARESALTLTQEGFERNTALFRGEIDAWEATEGVFDEVEDGRAVNGIHVRIGDEYGWDYVRRYVRAWKVDPIINGLMGVGGEDPPTPLMRASFFAAQIGASVEQDLLDRFRDTWRFVVDEDLYQSLFNRFMVTMETPYPGG